jgi:hypothetical protein
MKMLVLLLVSLAVHLQAETPQEKEIARLKDQVKKMQALLAEPDPEVAHYKELWQRMRDVADKALTRADSWEMSAKEMEAAAEANYKAAQEWKAEALRLQALLDRFTAPVAVNRPPPTANPSSTGSTTTTISGSAGVYTTQGGKAGGATIIETAPGHFEIRQPDGTTQQVIKTTP